MAGLEIGREMKIASVDVNLLQGDRMRPIFYSCDNGFIVDVHCLNQFCFKSKSRNHLPTGAVLSISEV